jgi:hypothetical protein
MTTKVTHELRESVGWVLIGSQEASNDASLTQTGLDSTYDAYCIIISAFVPSVDANESIILRFGDSSGIDSGGSDYTCLRELYLEGTTTYSGLDFGDRADMICGSAHGTGTGEGGSAVLWLLNPGDAGVRNHIHGRWIGYDLQPELRGAAFYGMRNAAITLDRILVAFQSSNIVSGRFTVWGMKHT